MLVPQGTSAIMELSRANSIAEKLGSKSMLLPGVAPSALPPPDADIVEGLRAGDDTAFFEAADAYLEVCNDAHCDKSYMQTWQRHAAAPFAEALMDLVAIYRTTQPAAAPPALALPPAPAPPGAPSPGAPSPLAAAAPPPEEDGGFEGTPASVTQSAQPIKQTSSFGRRTDSALKPTSSFGRRAAPPPLVRPAARAAAAPRAPALAAAPRRRAAPPRRPNGHQRPPPTHR